jgi:allantoin racemase
MKLLLVNGNRTEAVTERALRVARHAASAGTTVTGVTARFGADYVRSRAEEAIAAHAVLDALAQHAGTFDAAALAISLDSGLLAARQLLPVPVVGMTEAALYLACQLAERIGVLTTGAEARPLYVDLIRRYGLEPRIAELRTLDTSKHADPLQPQDLTDRLRAEALALAEDPGIGCIVLCGAVYAGLAAELAAAVPVPILDCISAAVAQAEVLARLQPAGGRRLTAAVQMAGVSAELQRLFHSQKPTGSDSR